MRILRLLWVGWKFHVKSLTLSAFFILTSILQPIIFASVAYFMFRTGAREGTLLYVALGAGMMGIWSSTLFGSGGAIQWQRWQGTLEYCIAVPPPFLLVILPLTLATATIGLYSLTATLVWGWLFFDVPLEVADPLAFAVALPWGPAFAVAWPPLASTSIVAELLALESITTVASPPEP